MNMATSFKATFCFFPAHKLFAKKQWKGLGARIIVYCCTVHTFQSPFSGRKLPENSLFQSLHSTTICYYYKMNKKIFKKITKEFHTTSHFLLTGNLL